MTFRAPDKGGCYRVDEANNEHRREDDGVPAAVPPEPPAEPPDTDPEPETGRFVGLGRFGARRVPETNPEEA